MYIKIKLKALELPDFPKHVCYLILYCCDITSTANHFDISVAKASKELCRSSTFLKLVSKEGYLSSEVAATTGCGSVSSPWILEAKPGQNLNLTLLDFTRSTGTDTGVANTWGECR